MKKENQNKSYLLFKKIPLVALIFPPIGLLMLLNFLLKKYNNNKSKQC